MRAFAAILTTFGLLLCGAIFTACEGEKKSAPKAVPNEEISLEKADEKADLNETNLPLPVREQSLNLQGFDEILNPRNLSGNSALNLKNERENLAFKFSEALNLSKNLAFKFSEALNLGENPALNPQNLSKNSQNERKNSAFKFAKALNLGENLALNPKNSRENPQNFSDIPNSKHKIHALNFASNALTHALTGGGGGKGKC